MVHMPGASPAGTHEIVQSACRLQEELAEREKLYTAHQERLKLEKRQKELEEHKRRKLEEEAEAGLGPAPAVPAGPRGAWNRPGGAAAALAAPAAVGSASGAVASDVHSEVEEAFMKLSDAALSLMRE